MNEMNMNEMDVINEQNLVECLGTEVDASHDDLMMSTVSTRVSDPIIIRGTGNITIFALSNKFDDEYPTALIHRISRDEFQQTIKRINAILKKTITSNFKWFIFGCFCCCCTIGLSFTPVLFLNNHAKQALKQTLDVENTRIYHRLGYHWQLARQKCPNSIVQEYVLMIDSFLTMPIFHPD